MAYPSARRADIVEELHGHRVADPYRWLEDTDTPETRAWSAAQDEAWAAWAGAEGSARGALRARLTELIPGFRSAPYVVGDRRYWTERVPGQDHAVLRVDDGGGVRDLVDPNVLAPDGSVTLDGWAPSLEGDRLAYQLSTGGDEESRLSVLDATTGQVLDGPIDRTRYSPVTWMPGGEAFFYVRRLPPGAVPAGEEAYHRRLWWHRVGTDPDDDILVFGGDVALTAYLGAQASADGRWLVVTVSEGTAPRNELWLADLSAGRPLDDLSWVPVVVGRDMHAWPHLDRRGALWVLTDADAPRRRLCRVDPAEPAFDRWTEMVAEDPDGAVLEDFALSGEALVLLHSRHALSEVTVADRADGGSGRLVSLPGPVSADLHGRPDEGPEMWVGVTDHVTPYRVLDLDPVTATVSARPELTAGAEHEGRVAPGPVVSRLHTYRSADGTEVRLTVVAPAGDPDRPRPTVLYGYGGFDVALTPAYSSTVLAWVRAGGVWAVANLRGGSEEGEDWHRDGMRQHKHHVYEDLEAAGAWLVEGGWTTRDQLGIMGGSNGGLLVGAALTRRPDDYAAVVCSAPLLDMVRYERFGLGATWNDEYGSAEVAEELGWLLGYSPYHHVTPGRPYPAVLFTIFDGDSRVDPLHARKMAAALQFATTADPARRPILVRREADVGHGARAVRRAVDLGADQLAFLGWALGLDLHGG